MLNETSAGGCACRIAFTSRHILKMPLWNGYSQEGLCGPEMEPSGRTRMMSDGRSEPLSMPDGLIHMSPSGSSTERLPPLVVVMPFS